MLMQEKQDDMPQHLVLSTDLLSRESLSSKSMLLRQELTLTLFTQTKQYCNFVKTGLTTSQLWHCFSQPLLMLQVRMRPH